MGIVIIKNRQDAQDYLINQFAPTDSDNRASNALLGAVAGALGGGYLGRKDGQKAGKMKALHLMRGMRNGTAEIS